MNRRLIILFLCMIGLIDLCAQEIITGTVVDSKNIPIPGVRVEVVGRSETTTTDIEGRFRLDLPLPVKKLRFQYIGQKPIERKVKPDMIVKMGHGWAGRDSGYRGFFNFVGGFGSGGVMNFYLPGYSLTEVGKNSAMFGINTTHGYQIMPMLYAGVGAGITSLMLYNLYNSDSWGYGEYSLYGVAFQFYGDVRWDLDIKAKTTPFIDLKVGYQRILSTGDMDDYEWNNYRWSSIEGEHTGGFLLMPTVGLRTAIGAKRAINIGLSYNVFVKRAFTITSSSDIHLPNGDNINNSIPTKKVSASGGCVMLNFGFDF